jgi:hypothetical protein
VANTIFFVKPRSNSFRLHVLEGDCKLSAFEAAFVSVHLSAALVIGLTFLLKRRTAAASKVNLMHHERNPTRSGNHYTPRA